MIDTVQVEWIEKVKLEIRALDAQAERITRREKTTWRDGADQGEREEDFEEVIIGYKMNTGCWHRLLGLLACAPAAPQVEGWVKVPKEVYDALIAWSGQEPSQSVLARAVDEWMETASQLPIGGSLPPIPEKESHE